MPFLTQCLSLGDKVKDPGENVGAFPGVDWSFVEHSGLRQKIGSNLQNELLTLVFNVHFFTSWRTDVLSKLEKACILDPSSSSFLSFLILVYF